MQDILDWVHESLGPDVIHEAWLEFSLWDEDAPPLDLETPHRQMFTSWFLYVWHPGVLAVTDIRDSALQGLPLANAYLKGRAGGDLGGSPLRRAI